MDVNGTGERFGAGALTLRSRLVPSAQTSPTLTVGLGGLFSPDVPNSPSSYLYATALAGIESRIRPSLGLFLEAGVDYPFYEGLDGLQGSGSVNDNIWVGRGGFVFYTSF